MAEPCELTADEIELQALNGTGEPFPSFLHCITTLNHTFLLDYFTLALLFSLSSATPPPYQTSGSSVSRARATALRIARLL
jgi:hypothetical protein